MTFPRSLTSFELPKHTPWGPAESGSEYAPGIIFVHTPGHGGFILDSKQNGKVHEAWRQNDCTYEKDCNWAIVSITFPELFNESENSNADQILRNWLPYEYMTVTNKNIKTEESRFLRQQAFKEKNNENYVVISAEGRGDVVKVTATKGGDRRSEDKKNFIVSRDEYIIGENGFVIDLQKHLEISV